MLKSQYNPETRQCKICNCIVGFDDASIAAHECSDFREPLKDIKKHYEGPKKKPIYSLGEEIEVKFFGKIVGITATEKNVYYKIEDVDSGAFGTVKEMQIQELLEPDDFEPEQYNEDGGEDR
jgi:hypothetical protein